MLKLETLARELVACVHRYNDGEMYFGTDGDEKLKELQAHLTELEANRGAHAADIQAARDEYAYDEDTKIDADPLIAPAEDGVWVSAWVYVASEDESDPLDEA